MSPRHSRRLAAMLAVVAGVSTITAAATKQRHHAGFLGVEWAANVVIGGRYGLLVCGVTLVVLARGLLHGKRTAHRLALIAAPVAAVSLHLRSINVVVLGALALLIVVLLVGRRAFRASSDPARARRGWWILVAGETTVLLYGIVGLYLLDYEFQGSTSVITSVISSLRLLFLLPGTTVSPATPHGGFFLDSVRVSSFAVAMAGVIGIVATVVARAAPGEEDRRTTEALLARWATTGLAPFVLADDKNWWFAADRSAVLAYKVVGRTAVVLGEPIGSPAGCIAAARGFLEFCDGNGWTVGFHQVTGAGRERLAGVGLHSLKVGETAVLPVDEFDLSTPKHKSLRSALRRIERSGCRVVVLDQPIDAATMDALRDVSDAWLALGGHRERTFTLGRFDADYLRSTTVLALLDAKGQIVAFVNLLPTYQSVNGNFDLMRRSADAPNGAMEALFVAMIERCRAQGLAGLDLGMVPFANPDESSIAGRTLRAIYEGGRSVFNFEGLRSFKQKWDPKWEARYICYQTDADLPTIAAAIARAGELPDSRSIAGRIRAFVRRFPVAVSIIGVQVYVMAATNWNVALSRQLRRHFAFGWHDLVHLQLWRLVTSPFVPDGRGFAWGNLLVLVPVLFIAERRFGSTWTAILFTLGDLLSTLAVVVGARLAAAWGSTAALHAALERDGGSSSAGLALVAACVVSLRRDRLRNSAIVGLVVLVGLVAVIHQAEADVQHFGAVVCGLGLATVFNRRLALHE
jgi:phosphatidylglycerol lysyltransferase